jgi:2-polyprenyl-3-methyl-5-hydroxy-6-metoxy-1,4-benzoquinol methylase
MKSNLKTSTNLETKAKYGTHLFAILSRHIGIEFIFYLRFGHHATKSVIKWIKKKIEKTFKIIDLGCGNGFTCCELANEGYSSVFGIDYSAKAIDLAKAVALKQNLNITYKVIIKF